MLVYTLLGGACRYRVRVDYWTGRRTPEEAGPIACLAKEKGFRGFKMKCALTDPSVERVEEIVARCGPDFEIVLEPNQRFEHPVHALRIARQVEQYRVRFEDPVPRWNLDWYRLPRTARRPPSGSWPLLFSGQTRRLLAIASAISFPVDVGFDDVVDPSPAELPFPTLLPLDAPVIRAYPPEAVIAEKFQAMVALGIANSRMKDFFDIWTFAITQRFNISRLSQSICRTFEQRRTGLPATPPVALTDEFLLDTVKRTQWAAFCKRLGLRDTPALDATGPVLIRFLMPVVEQARQQEPDALIWEPPGPWRKAERMVE